MNRHINALVSFLVFAFTLALFAGIFAHLLSKHDLWGPLANKFTFAVLCFGSLALLVFAIQEIVIIRKLKSKYVTVL